MEPYPSKELVQAPEKIEDVEHHLRAIAEAWKHNTNRPKLEDRIVIAWDELIIKWSNDPVLPLIVRCQPACTGTRKVFDSREVIFSDNSTAQWVFRKAYDGDVPTLEEIQKWIESKELPIAQNYTKEERKAEKFYESILKPKYGVNKKGWRLAHMQAIGTGKLPEDEKLALEKLKEHFVKFLSPSNMLLVPSTIGAFAEIKTVLDAFVEDEEGTVPTDSQGSQFTLGTKASAAPANSNSGQSSQSLHG